MKPLYLPLSSLCLSLLVACGGDGPMSSASETAPTATGPSSTTTGDAASGTEATGDLTEAAPTSSNTATPMGACGDGQLDSGEECDDGAANGDANACSSECTVNACPADTAIALLSRTPAGEAAPFPHDGAITLSFACTVDRATVNDTTVWVHGSQSGRRALTVEWGEGSDATLVLAAPLHPGERIDVTLTAAIRDLGGNALSPQVFHFLVSGAPGLATFSAADLTLGGQSPPALGDIDGDHDIDIVRSNGALFVNEGDVFTQSAGFSAFCEPITLADIDGDHDLDILCPGGFNKVGRIWHGDGAGGFAEAPEQSILYSIEQLAAGDLDGDGDLDLWAVSAPTADADLILINDGTGVFSQHASGLGSKATFALTLGDADGDGDLDALVGNGNLDEQAGLWLNDGAGDFTAVDFGFGGGPHGAVDFADLNSDGRADLIILPFFDDPSQVWIGDMVGMFSPGSGLDTTEVQGALARDLDGDGDLDVVCANHDVFIKANHVRLNGGDGTFTSGAAFGGGGDSIAVGDLNGDGRVDVLVDDILFTGD